MWRKLFIGVSVSASLTLSLVYAEGEPKKPEGEGFLMYKNKEDGKGGKKTKRTVEELLADILDTEKEQLKVQKEILSLMKDQYDVPKMVKVNGKECLANSSAECFVMPITGDAKRIPVMRQWMENPTIENAIAYYKWQSKYFNQVIDSGYSLNFAGKSVDYPHSGVPTYMEKTGDYEEQDRFKKHVAKVIKKQSPYIEIYILMGKNSGFDVENKMSVFTIYENLRKMGIKTKFVFETKEDLAKYDEMISAVISDSFRDKWNKVPNTDKVISEATFGGSKTIEVHTTPMYIMRYSNPTIKKGYTQVLGVGKDNWRDIFDGLQRSLMLWKVVKPDEFSGSKGNEAQLNDIMGSVNRVYRDGNEKTKEKAIKYKKVLEKRIKEEESK